MPTPRCYCCATSATLRRGTPPTSPDTASLGGTDVRDRRPSLNDVARNAGVSVSTVSRYLKGQLRLRPDTESKVLQSMEAMGYEPQPNASRAASTAAVGNVIGLVIPEVGNTYFSRIANAVVVAAEGSGYSVLVTSTSNNPRKQLDYVELLAALDVAGIIYAGNYASNAALAAAVSSGVQVVVLDEQLSGIPPVDAVLVDDYAGAYQAATYLLSLGHENIALVTGPTDLRSVKERTRGWGDALARAGLSPDGQLQLHGTFSEEFGAAALSHLLASGRGPTAVFAASDVIALGIMSAARRMGIEIPTELSVVGFDDVPAASLVTPRLTTVRTPLDQMADTAVHMLVDRLDGHRTDVRTVTTSVSLVVGGTTAPAAVPAVAT